MSDTQEDSISRTKKVLNMVDGYFYNQNSDTRGDLRKHLMDEFDRLEHKEREVAAKFDQLTNLFIKWYVSEREARFVFATIADRDEFVQYMMGAKVLSAPPDLKATEKRKLFKSLPLGTRFKYVGGTDVWVVLERHGLGLLAKWDGVDGWLAGQSICSFAGTPEECETTEVVVVE